jgi:uncharacterized short protein YbdD (DUF466 family)
MTKLTAESITAARQFFADNANACIADAVSGAVKVNNLDKYVSHQRKAHDDALSGVYDHTFAARQRAYFIQTGHSVALFGA